MSSVIPETDSPVVAAIAAALHVAMSQDKPSMKEFMTDYVDAFEIVAKAASLRQNVDEARTKLKELGD